jgi:phosphoglycolate phosphatase-like HAD superfamily hydrolase
MLDYLIQNQLKKRFALKDEKVQVKAILFDLDGTIFDITERDAFARYQALNDLGYDVSLDDVKKHYHCGAGTMGVVKELGIKFSEKEEKEYIEASFAHFTDRENALRFTKIQTDAYNALSTLSEKFKLILVTSRNILSSTEEELGWFNIREFFTLIVTREVAARYYGIKDIPLLPFREQRTKLFKCAIGLTNIDPKEMLCVGDAVSEIEPAKNLGIRAIGVLTGFSSKEDMENASISTVKDLAELVKTLS